MESAVAGFPMLRIVECDIYAKIRRGLNCVKNKAV